MVCLHTACEMKDYLHTTSLYLSGVWSQSLVGPFGSVSILIEYNVERTWRDWADVAPTGNEHGSISGL